MKVNLVQINIRVSSVQGERYSITYSAAAPNGWYEVTMTHQNTSKQGVVEWKAECTCLYSTKNTPEVKRDITSRLCLMMLLDPEVLEWFPQSSHTVQAGDDTLVLNVCDDGLEFEDSRSVQGWPFDSAINGSLKNLPPDKLKVLQLKACNKLVIEYDALLPSHRIAFTRMNEGLS